MYAFSQVAGDTYDSDVGVHCAAEAVATLCEYLMARSLWETSVVGVKASYDGVHRVVLYLHSDVSAGSGVLDAIVAVASSWGAKSLRIGISGQQDSPIIKFV